MKVRLAVVCLLLFTISLFGQTPRTVLTVTNLADMLLLPTNDVRFVVIVKDSLRGGTFEYVPGDSTTTNSGTVFAYGTGRLKRQYSGALDVRWFGATGNGATNDTAAIQAALDEASERPIYIPAGTYKVSRNGSNSYCLLLSTRRSVYGDGMFATKLEMGDGTASAVDGLAIAPTGDFSSVVLRDFSIYPETNGDGRYGLSVTTTSGIQVRYSELLRVAVGNFGTGSLLVSGTEDYVTAQLFENTVRHCRFDDGVDVTYAGDSWVWSENVFTGRGVIYSTLGGAGNTMWRENTFVCPPPQLWFKPLFSGYQTITHNYFEYTTVQAGSLLYVEGAYGASGVDFTITDNLFNYNGTTNAIALLYTTNAVVTGNYFVNVTDTDIPIQLSEYSYATRVGGNILNNSTLGQTATYVSKNPTTVDLDIDGACYSSGNESAWLFAGGTNSYAYAASSDHIGTGDFAAMCRFTCPTSSATTYGLLTLSQSVGGVSANAFSAYIASGTLRVAMYGNPSTSILVRQYGSFVSTFSGKPVTLVISRSDSDVRVWANGVPLTAQTADSLTGSTSWAESLTAAYINVGVLVNSTTTCFDGDFREMLLVDGLGIESDADARLVGCGDISSGTVIAHYQTGSCYKLGSTLVLLDISPNARHATATAGVSLHEAWSGVVQRDDGMVYLRGIGYSLPSATGGRSDALSLGQQSNVVWAPPPREMPPGFSFDTTGYALGSGVTLGSNTYTICVWLRLPEVGSTFGTRGMFSLSTATNGLSDGALAAAFVNNSLRVYQYGVPSSNNRMVDYQNVIDGNWANRDVMLAITRTNTTLATYINSELLSGSETTAGTPPNWDQAPATNYIQLGAFAANYYNGSIYGFAISTNCLTQAQLKEVLRAPITTFCDPILFVDPFGQWSGLLADSSGNNNHLHYSTGVQNKNPQLLPAITTTKRDALTPAAGNLIWNTTATEAQVYTGATWSALGGGADGDAIHDNVSGEISAITEKASPVSGDVLIIEDSASSYAKKKVQIANLPGGPDPDAVHVDTSGEIHALTEKASPVDDDEVLIEDSADSYAKKRVKLSNLPSGSGASRLDELDDPTVPKQFTMETNNLYFYFNGCTNNSPFNASFQIDEIGPFDSDSIVRIRQYSGVPINDPSYALYIDTDAANCIPAYFEAGSAAVDAVFSKAISVNGVVFDGTPVTLSQTVLGPGSATAQYAVPVWADTTGTNISESTVLIDGSGNITGVSDITMSGTLTAAQFNTALVVVTNSIASPTNTTGNFVATNTMQIPNSSSDFAMTVSGQMAFNTTDEQISFHSGTDGEISGEAALSLIQTRTWTFDPKVVCDGAVDRMFLMWIGKESPEGITIDQWKISFEADPTTEIDADLKYADAMIGVAGATIMDALDTTNGYATEDTDSSINSGAVVANGKVLYIEFVTPYTEANHQIMFQLWWHAEED